MNDLTPYRQSDEDHFVALCLNQNFSQAYRLYPHLKPIPEHLKIRLRDAFASRHRHSQDNPQLARIADATDALNAAKAAEDHHAVIKAIRLLHDLDPPTYRQVTDALSAELVMASTDEILARASRAAMIDALAIVERRVPCDERYRLDLLHTLLAYAKGRPLLGMDHDRLSERKTLRELAKNVVSQGN
jgi:hypothetical protein